MNGPQKFALWVALIAAILVVIGFFTLERAPGQVTVPQGMRLPDAPFVSLVKVSGFGTRMSCGEQRVDFVALTSRGEIWMCDDGLRAWWKYGEIR